MKRVKKSREKGIAQILLLTALVNLTAALINLMNALR